MDLDHIKILRGKMQDEKGVLVKATNGAPFEFPLETWTDEHPTRMVIRECEDGFLELHYAGTVLANEKAFLYPLIENAMYEIDKVQFTEGFGGKIVMTLPKYTTVLTGETNFWNYYKEVDFLPDEYDCNVEIFPSDDLLIQLSGKSNNVHVGVLSDTNVKYYMTAQALAFEMYAGMFYRQCRKMVNSFTHKECGAFNATLTTGGGYCVDVKGCHIGKSVLKITDCTIKK